MAQANCASSTPTSCALSAALDRFETSLLQEIRSLQGERVAALRVHDHGRARAKRRDLDRALTALADVAEFRAS